MRLSAAATPLLGLTLVSAQLNELAQKAGKKYFGTATDSPELSNKTYFDILTDTREFGQITPSNGQKWMFVEPELHVFNFTEGEIITNLTRKTHQILRCHNTVWHSQLADWVTADTWDKANFTAMLIEHVTKEVAHWKGQCYAWDVVNEGLNEDGTLRNTTFLQILGEEYLPIAFRAAAAADPDAKLYYNDYNIEAPGAKSDGARRIVKLVQDAGVRIDGVGLQGHFIAGQSPTIDQMITNMRNYTSLGVEVAVTELDIRIYLPVNASNLEAQKQGYKATTGACVQVEGCVGITVWDFYDPFSWVPGVFAGQGAPTLYFDNFTKHPAYYGVVEALTNNSKPCKGKPGKARAKRSDPLF